MPPTKRRRLTRVEPPLAVVLRRMARKRGIVRLSLEQIPHSLEGAVLDAVRLADDVHDLDIKEALVELQRRLIVHTQFFASIVEVSLAHTTGCTQYLHFPIIQVQIGERLYFIGHTLP